MSELKVCPFCGMNGEAKYTVDYGGRTIFQCQWCGASHHSFDDWNNRPIEDALRARIAELEAAARWIPVEERLPEKDSRVLAVYSYEASGDTFYGVDTYKFNSGAWYEDFEIYQTDLTITHWQPLPPPPEAQS